MTEFGNLALIDQDAGEEDGVAVPLPGVRKGGQGLTGADGYCCARALWPVGRLLGGQWGWGRPGVSFT